MAGFYKVVIRAVCVGQEINNILYYAPIDPSNEEFNEEDAEDLGNAVASAWGTQFFPHLPAVYTLQGTDVSMIDETGETISPFVVSTSNSGTGTNPGSADGPGACIILKFNCTTVVQATGHSVPRRSYIAVGPVPTEAIGTSGLISSLPAWQTAAESALTQGHLINAVQMLPYRIGRDHPASSSDPTNVPGGVGAVHSVIARPYASFRRSRMFSPTGN